jgi:hypothetical protein
MNFCLILLTHQLETHRAATGWIWKKQELVRCISLRLSMNSGRQTSGSQYDNEPCDTRSSSSVLTIIPWSFRIPDLIIFKYARAFCTQTVPCLAGPARDSLRTMAGQAKIISLVSFLETFPLAEAKIDSALCQQLLQCKNFSLPDVVIAKQILFR